MLLNYYQEFIIRTAILITAIYLSVPLVFLITRSLILTFKHPESKRLLSTEDNIILLLPPASFSWLAYLALLYL